MNLAASDVKILIKSEEELAACQGFDRVFPTSETHKYFQFMEEVRLRISCDRKSPDFLAPVCL